MDLGGWKIVLVAAALALAGCAGDDGDDGGDGNGDGTGTGTSTGTGTGTTTTTTTTPPMTGAGEPVYVNGTVSGVADCALLGVDAPPAGGTSGDVPAGMENGSYELSMVDASGTEDVCIYFEDGTTGDSGSVPAAATTFRVYADRAPAGVAYSIKFTPAM